MSEIPVVIEAQHRGDHKIHLVFQDGTQGTVDLSDSLEGPVFEPLRDPEFFARFFIEAGTLVWPNGADIAPESLYEKVKTNGAA
ncbi:MAG: DUF2442 domain-containing protein [Actinomycetota bacterium]